MVTQSSSLLVVTLMVRELTTEAHAVNIGRVRSIRPTPTAVSTSTSAAVKFTLRTTTTVTTASAFVAFANDFIIIKECNKYIKKKNTKPEGKMSSGYFISFRIRMGGHHHPHLLSLLLRKVLPPPLSLVVSVYVRWLVVFHPRHLQLVLRPFRVIFLH